MNYKNILPATIDCKNLTDEDFVVIIRHWRNLQLAASDWTQLPDVALTSDQVQAWAQYRHELREMLKQNDDPKLIVFPEPPK
jgi:hypothetical protein